MVKEIEQVSNAKISLGTTRGGGPFLNLIVVFGEYIRVNILIFFISSGGMVVGSSLTAFLHLDKGINQYEGFITYTCCDAIHAHA